MNFVRMATTCIFAAALSCSGVASSEDEVGTQTEAYTDSTGAAHTVQFINYLRSPKNCDDIEALLPAGFDVWVHDFTACPDGCKAHVSYGNTWGCMKRTALSPGWLL